MVAPPGAAGRSSLRSPRLSRHPHDRARCVVRVKVGLFGIVFLVRSDVSGSSCCWRPMAKFSSNPVPQNQTFSYAAFSPPFLLLRVPLVPRSLSRRPLRCLRVCLYFLSSFRVACAAVSCRCVVSIGISTLDMYMAEHCRL